MSLLVWRLEWRVARARRRLFLLNVGIPLLLVAPVATSGAPRVHAAAVYVVLFVLHPVFGAAVPLVRDGERGLVGRVLRGGVAPAEYLLQRAGAGAALDALQLLPAATLAWWGLGAEPAAVAPGLVGLVGALWVGNLMGALVAAAARSVGETALLAAVVSLLLLHGSGVFRTPPPGSVAAAAEAASPFRLLHEALLLGPRAWGETAGAQGAASLLAWSVALPLLVVLLARPLGAWLGPSPGGPAADGGGAP